MALYQRPRFITTPYCLRQGKPLCATCDVSPKARAFIEEVLCEVYQSHLKIKLPCMEQDQNQKCAQCIGNATKDTISFETKMLTCEAFLSEEEREIHKQLVESIEEDDVDSLNMVLNIADGSKVEGRKKRLVEWNGLQIRWYRRVNPNLEERSWNFFSHRNPKPLCNALHMACSLNSLECVKCLIEHGTTTANIEDSSGFNALVHAIGGGASVDMLEYINDIGKDMSDIGKYVYLFFYVADFSHIYAIQWLSPPIFKPKWAALSKMKLRHKGPATEDEIKCLKCMEQYFVQKDFVSHLKTMMITNEDWNSETCLFLLSHSAYKAEISEAAAETIKMDGESKAALIVVLNYLLGENEIDLGHPTVQKHVGTWSPGIFMLSAKNKSEAKLRVNKWTNKDKLEAAKNVIEIWGTLPNQVPEFSREDAVHLLYCSCAYGSVETVRQLIDMVTLFDKLSNEEMNETIYVALSAGRADILKTLPIYDVYAFSIMLASCTSLKESDLLQIIKSYKTLDLWSDSPHRKGINPLGYATQNNNVAVMKLIYESNPHWIDSGTPRPICIAADKGHIKAVRFLLSASKLDINHPGPDGITPLQMAQLRKKKSVIYLLEEYNGGKNTQTTLEKKEKRQHGASKLIETTKIYPLFNENIDKAADSFKKAGSPLKNVMVLCTDNIRDGEGKLTQQVAQMKGPFLCSNELMSCQMTLDLLVSLKMIENELNRGLFSKLKPFLTIIGSTIEGTRLSMGNEIDSMLMFESLNDPVFRLAEHAGSAILTEEGKEMLPRYCGEGSTFDYFLFLTEMLDELDKIMTRVQFPKSVTTATRCYEPCQNCLLSQSTEFDPIMHCEECRPSVAMTKLGPCLILSWTNSENENEKPHTCTIDLIPCFQHEESSLTLFNHMVKSLLDHKPPGCVKTLESYLTRDRILPEEISSALENSPEERSLVSFKIQHFSDQQTDFQFLLRPGQKIFMKALLTNNSLREAYIKIKFCKSLFEIEGLPSFRVKKILLQDNIQRLAMVSPDLAWRAVMDGPLKNVRHLIEVEVGT